MCKLFANHNKYSLMTLASCVRYDLFRQDRDLFRPRGTMGLPKSTCRFDGYSPKNDIIYFVALSRA